MKFFQNLSFSNILMIYIKNRNLLLIYSLLSKIYIYKEEKLIFNLFIIIEAALCFKYLYEIILDKKIALHKLTFQLFTKRLIIF